MFGSINKTKKFLTPEKAAWLIPVFISSGLSILSIIFFVLPQYKNSTKVNLELNGLNKKKNELNNLKSQYKIINQKFAKLNKEKVRIIELISGTSNLDTLLAKLGEIGKKNNIEFVSIVPKKIVNFIDSSLEKNTNTNKNKDKNKKLTNVIIDPLLVEGTKKYLIDFTFKTNFINLLSFLRDLEFQENVILLNGINIDLISRKSNNVVIDNDIEILEVKIEVTFYGKT